jgi:hypothetical protein
MKKFILAIIVTLSTNILAQNGESRIYIHHSKLNSVKDDLGKMDEVKLLKNASFHERKLDQRLNISTLQPSQLIQIYDSIYTWQWDDQTMDWGIDLKLIDITYNVNHYQITGLYQNLMNDIWVNFSNYTYTYDTNDNLISFLRQNWVNNGWVNYSKYTYTYDDNDNIINELFQISYGIDWENYYFHTNIYDANNNLISILIQEWEIFHWDNYRLFTYTYDVNNNQTSRLIQQWHWNSNTWENTSLVTYTYDANNNQTNILQQVWNEGNWENDMLTIYNYSTNNNPMNGLSKSWNGNTWEDKEQETFTYDVNNNLIIHLFQYWNDSSWVNGHQFLYTYDANNFKISKSYKDWNNSGSVIADGDSTYNYYHTILGIDDLMEQEDNITIFPNPCIGTFTINSKIAFNSIEIYDLFGEQLFKILPSTRQTLYKIDLTDEPKGIYFTKMNIGTKVYTRKIIVQ